MAFSNGSLGGTPSTMVYIRFGESFRELVAEFDVLLLLHGGKLVRARNLVPGDSLVSEQGKPLPVHMVSVGQYLGGVHALSAPFPSTPSDNLDGHLLLANGVIIGDFYLQMHWRGE